MPSRAGSAEHRRPGFIEDQPRSIACGVSGLAADDLRAAQPELWRGLNLLGVALTEARMILSQAA